MPTPRLAASARWNRSPKPISPICTTELVQGSPATAWPTLLLLVAFYVRNKRKKASRILIHPVLYNRQYLFPYDQRYPRDPDAPGQPEMDRLLESEMQATIFYDPNFVEHFLSVDSIRLQAVLKDPSIREVLFIVKASAGGSEDTDQLLDISTEPILAHYDDTAGVKPDLALFERAARRWETVRTPIEVKERATYLKSGMK
ncbi:hypothetical protein FRC09_000624 [Ceratobasidium sp. 395]|nr:hypothetical protein FRC09_000624 [Ceratobasidium sp. 395]